MTENVMDERQRNPMPKMPKIQSRIWRQALIALLIVAAGLFLFGLLTNMRRPPARIERPVMAPLVEAITVHPENLEMTVEGFGTAQARRSVQIVPQVSGRVIACSPNFMDGGFFAAGEPHHHRPATMNWPSRTPRPPSPAPSSSSSRKRPKPP